MHNYYAREGRDASSALHRGPMRNAQATALVTHLQASAKSARAEELIDVWGWPALRAAVRSGDLIRLLPDVYVATEHSAALSTRAHAVTTWLPQGYVAGSAAAAMWELCTWTGGTMIVRAPYGTKRVPVAWLRMRRELEAGQTINRCGTTLATPSNAVATAFDERDIGAAREALFRAVQTSAANLDDIASRAAGMPRLRHRRALLAALESAADGAESHAEATALRKIFVGREFEGLMPQHWLIARGQRVRLDLYHPASRTAIEIDGMAFHGAVDRRVADMRRDARLASVGVMTLRFPARDVLTNGRWCRAVAAEAIASRLLSATRRGS